MLYKKSNRKWEWGWSWKPQGVSYLKYRWVRRPCGHTIRAGFEARETHRHKGTGQLLPFWVRVDWRKAANRTKSNRG